jgi:hypothetical protein
MLDNHDQMLKGSRFIWYYWSQAIDAQLEEQSGFYEFKGKVSCFRQLSKNIIHERIIKKVTGKPEWMIEDIIKNKPIECNMRQLWHTNSIEKLKFNSADNIIKPAVYIGASSDYYGQRADCNIIEFSDLSDRIETVIRISETK